MHTNHRTELWPQVFDLVCVYLREQEVKGFKSLTLLRCEDAASQCSQNDRVIPNHRSFVVCVSWPQAANGWDPDWPYGLQSNVCVTAQTDSLQNWGSLVSFSFSCLLLSLHKSHSTGKLHIFKLLLYHMMCIIFSVQVHVSSPQFEAPHCFNIELALRNS